MPFRAANEAPTYQSGLWISVPPPASEPAASSTAQDHAAQNTEQPDFNELAPRNGPVAVACGRVLWPRDKLDGPVAVDRSVGDTRIA